MLDSELKTYPWNPTVKESPPRVHAEMVVRYPGCRCNLFLTYQKLTTNVWGLTAFLCQLLAVIELAFGLQFVRSRMEQKDIE